MSIAPGARFPGLALTDRSGAESAPADALAGRPALVILGHKDCDTTRLTLPYAERMHGQGARVLAILQDDAEGLAALEERIGPLTLPVFLDRAPHAFGAAIAASVVPTLLLVGEDGTIESVSEGFKRGDIEAIVTRLGLALPFFRPGEKAPALRPG